MCILDEYTLMYYLCLFGYTWFRPVDYIHNYTAAQVPTEMRGGHPDGQAGPADHQQQKNLFTIKLAKCDLRVPAWTTPP
jgi:hypothetical protein